MNATAEAKKERESHKGQDYRRHFANYCKKHRLNESPENWVKWDEQHNGSRVEKLLGTDEDFRVYGRWRKYYDAFYNWDISIRIPGTPHSMKDCQKTVNELRSRLSEAKPDDVEFWIARAKAEIRTGTQRLKMLKLPIQQIRDIARGVVDDELAAD